jgi:hypothetical protein
LMMKYIFVVMCSKNHSFIAFYKNHSTKSIVTDFS